MASTEMFATGFQRAPLPRHFGIVCPPPSASLSPGCRVAGCCRVGLPGPRMIYVPSTKCALGDNNAQTPYYAPARISSKEHKGCGLNYAQI